MEAGTRGPPRGGDGAYAEPTTTGDLRPSPNPGLGNSPLSPPGPWAQSFQVPLRRTQLVRGISAANAIPADGELDSSLPRTGRPEPLSIVFRLDVLPPGRSDRATVVYRRWLVFDIDVCRCAFRYKARALRRSCIGCHNVLPVGIWQCPVRAPSNAVLSR